MTVSLVRETPKAVHRAGELAYLFGPFSGPVPCAVLSVDKWGNGTGTVRGSVTVRLTATRGAWRKGETLTEPTDSIVPRRNLHTSSGTYWVSRGYAWR